MSEPAVFVLRRNGSTEFFADRWASAFLHREIVWGPDDFESWVRQFDTVDGWLDDCCGVAAVDFDKRTFCWSGETTHLEIPRVQQVFDTLLQTAWPGFNIQFFNSPDEIRTLMGIAPEYDMEDSVDDTDDEENPLEGEFEDMDDEDDSEDESEDHDDYRPQSIREATRYDEDDEEDEEDEEEDEEEDSRAWITIVDKKGTIRQRELEQLPIDLLQAKSAAVNALAKLRSVAIPKESIVREGMWIDISAKSVGIWGPPSLSQRLSDMNGRWKGWDVQWASNGYTDQCRLNGTDGIPMTSADALAKMLPLILSTKQFNMGTFVGAMGAGIKKMAIKATGCLLFVVCLPLLIFGFLSQNWTAVLITIVTTVAVVIVLFKIIEYRFKRAMRGIGSSGDDESSKTLAAGPQDESTRRERIDQLLAAAQLPRLVVVEPLFPKENDFDLLGD